MISKSVYKWWLKCMSRKRPIYTHTHTHIRIPILYLSIPYLGGYIGHTYMFFGGACVLDRPPQLLRLLHSTTHTHVCVRVCVCVCVCMWVGECIRCQLTEPWQSLPETDEIWYLTPPVYLRWTSECVRNANLYKFELVHDMYIVTHAWHIYTNVFGHIYINTCGSMSIPPYRIEKRKKNKQRTRKK